MRRHSNVSLAIIAGGRGSRLSGIPKGLLTYDGRSVVSRLLDLQALVSEVLLVSNEPSPYASFALRTVADVIPNRGAPGGLHAALVHARTEWVLAVGCDMPFIVPAVAELILSARAADEQIVAFEINGRLEPLLALYHSAIAGAWGAALSPQPSFRDIFQLFRVRLLSEEMLRAVDPSMRAIVSINTPADLAQFGVKLPASTPSVP
ncbi:MAG TPA: molybdenum cofactor guanylyltransferase [Myxococcaceae bacterium]|nr:molybdenum cofactor guanylyltransferase [Myxococcaceae bacterium]